MKSYSSPLLTLVAFVSTLCLSSSELRAQGSLTPPGPPGPTMKTLDQIEPRIDISTLPGDGTYLHVISVPGSYFLSGNLTNAAGGKGGIVITANEVTIDLAGFSVTNSGTSPADGIHAAAKHLTVHDGSIRGWNNGIAASLGSGGKFDHLVLAGNSAII